MAPQIEKLKTQYPSRYGVPVITHVDTEIFSKRYFTHCLNCTFCFDACCSSGVDVDIENVLRVNAHAKALEAYLGIPREAWFAETFTTDPEVPGGRYTRTRVVDGACVFLNRKGRGCLIHSFCLTNGMDYHELKPMVSSLFPLTFDDGVLHPAREVEDGTLICVGSGPTLYRGIRDELLYYFGDRFLEELDALEGKAPPEKVRQS